MKRTYERSMIELIAFEPNDVISASGQIGRPDEPIEMPEVPLSGGF